MQNLQRFRSNSFANADDADDLAINGDDQRRLTSRLALPENRSNVGGEFDFALVEHATVSHDNHSHLFGVRLR